jgi:taurine--2-oxoglutarate transaminase
MAAKGEAAQPMAALRRAAMDRGLHLYVHGNLLIAAPPLIVRRDEIETGLGMLDEVLAVADRLAG